MLTPPVPGSIVSKSPVPKVEVAILNLLASDWSTPRVNLETGAMPVLKTIWGSKVEVATVIVSWVEVAEESSNKLLGVLVPMPIFPELS